MAKVEKIMKRNFGDAKDPLLLSVRSSARASMPGMMETVLNVGLTTKTIPGLTTGYKLIEKIRDEYGYQLPIVVYTAVHKPDLFNILRKQQNCSVLHKPDPPYKIVKALEEYQVYPKPQ